MRALRYNVELPFHLYLKQWVHGTRPGYFLTQLRKAKNPDKLGKTPEITDRDSFDLWLSNTMANFRQTKREQEGHYELQLRERHSNRLQYNSSRPKNSKNSRFRRQSNRQSQNKGEDDLKRQGPGYRQERNPHSKLLDKKPNQQDSNRSNPTGRFDMAKVKCFNCGKLGHYASNKVSAAQKTTQAVERDTRE